MVSMIQFKEGHIKYLTRPSNLTIASTESLISHNDGRKKLAC